MNALEKRQAAGRQNRFCVKRKREQRVKDCLVAEGESVKQKKRPKQNLIVMKTPKKQ